MHLYEKEVMKSYGYFPIKLAFLNSYADVSDSNALKYVLIAMAIKYETKTLTSCVIFSTKYTSGLIIFFVVNFNGNFANSWMRLLTKLEICYRSQNFLGVWEFFNR